MGESWGGGPRLTGGRGLIASFAAVEAQKKDMWGDTVPTAEAVAQLAACFEFEWGRAVDTMLRHWPAPPTWY